MRHISEPCKRRYQVLICPCHSNVRNFKKIKRRENQRVYNLQNYAFQEANNVNHLIKDLSPNDMINPFANEEKIDDDWMENSKGDPAGLFDYLRSQHGDEFLDKLKNNLKDRGIELHPPDKKKSKMPEYDLKKDEKDIYKKLQAKPVENFRTGLITQDSNFESSSDVSENSASLKVTEKLKPGTNSSKKAAMNESVADSINRRIDKEILPALAAISKQLNELKEKESNRSVEVKNNTNPEGFPCRLDGTWISELYGVKLVITTLKNMSLNVKVNSSKSSNGVIDNKWTIEGFTLAKFGGPFALIGIYPEKRGLVSFVGQCKVCKDEEAILGLWSVCSFKTEKNESLINIESKKDMMKKDKVLPVQKVSKLEDEDLSKEKNRRDKRNRNLKIRRQSYKFKRKICKA